MEKVATFSRRTIAAPVVFSCSSLCSWPTGVAIRSELHNKLHFPLLSFFLYLSSAASIIVYNKCKRQQHKCRWKHCMDKNKTCLHGYSHHVTHCTLRHMLLFTSLCNASSYFYIFQKRHNYVLQRVQVHNTSHHTTDALF